MECSKSILGFKSIEDHNFFLKLTFLYFVIEADFDDGKIFIILLLARALQMSGRASSWQ